jgi:hypothetical protein
MTLLPRAFALAVAITVVAALSEVPPLLPPLDAAHLRQSRSQQQTPQRALARLLSDGDDSGGGCDAVSETSSDVNAFSDTCSCE